MTASVLTSEDAQRAAATLTRLRRAGLQEAAITGGVAIAWHLREATGRHAVRALNDLDLVMSYAGATWAGLADGFLLRHIHLMPGQAAC